MAMSTHLTRLQFASANPDGHEYVITTGFRAKCGIMWGGKLPTQSNNYVARHTHPFLGWFDDALNNFCITNQNVNAVDTSISRNSMSNEFCILAFDNSGNSFDAKMKVTAIDDTTFTLTATVNVSANYRALMLTFGGDDITGTMAGSFLEKDSTGLLSVAGDEDVRGIVDGHGIVFLANTKHPASGFDATENSNFMSCGAAVSATKQGCNWFSSANGQASQLCFQAYSDEHCSLQHAHNSDTVRHKAKFSQWLDDGTNFLELDFDVLNFTNGDEIIFLVIKGGDWDMGQSTVPTSTGVETIPTTVIQSVVITMGMGLSANQDNVAEDVSWHMGAARSGTNDFSFGIYIQSGVDTTVNGPKSSNNDQHAVMTVPTTVLEEGNQQGFTGNPEFKIDWTTVDGSESIFNWIVAGDDTSPGGGSYDGWLPGKPILVKPWSERNVVSKEPFQLLLSARPKMLDPFTLTIDSVPHMVQNKVKVFNMLVHVQASQEMPPLKLGGIPRMQKPLGFSVGAGARYSHKPTQVVKIKVEAKDAHHYHLTLYGKKLKGMWYINEAKRRGVQIGNTLSFKFREAGRQWKGAITNIPPVGDPAPEPSQEREVSFDEPSTVVGRVTYNIDFQSMEVELNSTVYNYCNVPQSIFDSFAGAASKGAFYNRAVKGQFSC